MRPRPVSLRWCQPGRLDGSAPPEAPLRWDRCSICWQALTWPGHLAPGQGPGQQTPRSFPPGCSASPGWSTATAAVLDLRCACLEVVCAMEARSQTWSPLNFVPAHASLTFGTRRLLSKANIPAVPRCHGLSDRFSGCCRGWQQGRSEVARRHRRRRCHLLHNNKHARAPPSAHGAALPLTNPARHSRSGPTHLRASWQGGG